MSIDLYDIATGFPPRTPQTRQFRKKVIIGTNQLRDAIQPGFTISTVEVYNNTPLWVFVNLNGTIPNGITAAQMGAAFDVLISPFTMASFSAEASTIGFYIVANRANLLAPPGPPAYSTPWIISFTCYDYARPTGVWNLTEPLANQYVAMARTIVASGSDTPNSIYALPYYTRFVDIINTGSADIDVSFSGDNTFTAHTLFNGWTDFAGTAIEVQAGASYTTDFQLDPGWGMKATNRSGSLAAAYTAVAHGFS